MLRLNVNGQLHELDIDPDTPLLWALRDHLHLYGAKYGCGIGLCGSCTVHVDARAVRACMLSVAEVGDNRAWLETLFLRGKDNKLVMLRRLSSGAE